MAPDKRELTKCRVDTVFTLAGVNVSDQPAKAAALIKTEAMAWPSLWNGGATGGIVETLGVRSWPTVYVIDAKGIIRYKNKRGDALDQAVDSLLAEIDAETGD